MILFNARKIHDPLYPEYYIDAASACMSIDKTIIYLKALRTMYENHCRLQGLSEETIDKIVELRLSPAEVDDSGTLFVIDVYRRETESEIKARNNGTN